MITRALVPLDTRSATDASAPGVARLLGLAPGAGARCGGPAGA
jgi:hypothetical protein